MRVEKRARGGVGGGPSPSLLPYFCPAVLLGAILHVDSMLEPVTFPAHNMNNVCGNSGDLGHDLSVKNFPSTLPDSINLNCVIC